VMKAGPRTRADSVVPCRVVVPVVGEIIVRIARRAGWSSIATFGPNTDRPRTVSKTVDRDPYRPDPERRPEVLQTGSPRSTKAGRSSRRGCAARPISDGVPSRLRTMARTASADCSRSLLRRKRNSSRRA
jgi:hypothetical protein